MGLGDDDPTSRRVIKQILEKEEEHAEDLVTLLARLPAQKESVDQKVVTTKLQRLA